MRKRTAVDLVLAAALLGAALRLPGLNSGLWFDEIVTLVESVRLPLGQLMTVFPGNNNHPLYSLLAHFSVAALGDHAWTLRLPAVIFSVASIWLVYWLGARLTTEVEAVSAALLMAVAYHSVWFAQNARGYTMLLAFTLVCTRLAIDLVERPTSGRAAAYGVAAALGIYTHLTMVFVVGAHALVWGWQIVRVSPARRHSGVRAAAAALAIAAALSGGLYLPMAGEVYRFFTGPPQKTAAVATSSWAALEMLKGLRVGFGGLGVLGAAALMAIGGVSYLRHSPVAAMLFVLPGVLTGGAMVVLRAPIRPRFFFLMAGFALLMLVRGAFVTGTFVESQVGIRRRSIIGIAAVILIALVSAWSLGFNYRYPKQDFDGAMRFVDKNRAPADAVATGGLAIYPFEHYAWRPWKPLQTRQDLDELTRSAARTWVVYSFPEYMDAELVAGLRDRCREPQRFPGTLNGGDVVVVRCAAIDHVTSGR